MRQINYLVIHCTAGNQHESNADLIAGFRKRGWNQNGYHYVIDADGTVHNITLEDQVANGVQGHNANSIHISYKGGIDKDGKPADNRTPEQKEALINTLKMLRAKYPNAKIQGHRDFSPDTNHNGKIETWEYIKFCPCFDAIPEYADI